MTNEIAVREGEVDALFLANSVETPNSLAYVMGGGWTRCWPPQNESYPLRRPLPIVLMLRVPWSETNIDHQFRVSVRDSDEAILLTADGTFKTGRDASLLPGMSQLATMGITAGVQLEQTGIYSVVAEIDGRERKRIEFEALERMPNP